MGGTELTPFQKALREKYTKAERRDDGLQPIFVVGHQSFAVGYIGNKEEANFMRDMLAIALSRLYDEQYYDEQYRLGESGVLW